MTVFQFINGYYDGDTKNINIWCRSETGDKRMFRVTGFQPYMYISDSIIVPPAPWIVDIQKGYVSKDGEKLQKIIVTDPRQVGTHRDDYPKHWEADIEYVLRMLIDTKVKSCFSTDRASSIIPYTDLVPVERILPPLVLYMDIEVKIQGVRFPNERNPTAPVICVTFFDSLHKKYITFVVDDRYKTPITNIKEDNWTIVHIPNTFGLVEYVQQYFDYIRPDIVIGWNIQFDLGYYNAWCNYAFNKQIKTPGTEVFDLHEAYVKTKPSLGNRLKEVVVKEGVAKREDLIYESFRIDTYLDPVQRDEFILYNKRDVEYCVKLDTGFKDVNSGKWIEYQFIKSFWDEKNFVGLQDINMTTSHVARHDPLWLRTAQSLGMVLPSNPKIHDELGLDYGGIVFQPPAGVYHKLTVLDMSRYYPSILLSFPMETSPDIWGKLGPAVISYLLGERVKWDTELEKHEAGSEDWKAVKVTRDKVKTFLSGAWGYFVFPGSRIYNREKGNFVLKTAGEGLFRVRDRAAKVGHKTIYGDSVSADTNIPIVSSSGVLSLQTIESFFLKHENVLRGDGKEVCFPKRVNTITIDGNGRLVIRRILRVIRHVYEAPLFKIKTKNGLSVKVTAEHSIEEYKYGKMGSVSIKDINTDTILITAGNLYANMQDLWGGVQTPKSTCSKVTQNANLGVSHKIWTHKDRHGRSRDDERTIYPFTEGLLEEVPRIHTTTQTKSVNVTSGKASLEFWYDDSTASRSHGIGYVSTLARRKVGVTEKVLCQQPRSSKEERGLLTTSVSIRGYPSRENIGSYVGDVASPISQAIYYGKGQTRHSHTIKGRYEIGDIRGWVLVSLLSNTCPNNDQQDTETICGERRTGDVTFETDVKCKSNENMGMSNLQRSFECDKQYKADGSTTDGVSGRFLHIDFTSISSIEELSPEKFVYDLEVEDVHTFLANGILMHNTDSIFLDSKPEDVESLVGEVNDELRLWAIERGIEKTAVFKIKEDRYAKATLFVRGDKRGEYGAKKRYAQHIIREDDRPADYILIKGFDYVRGNTSEVTRKIQKDMLERVLREDTKSIISDLQAIIKDITSGKHELDDITIPVNVNEDWTKLRSGDKLPHGEYYTGVFWNNKFLKEGIIPGDLIRYFRVKKLNNQNWDNTNWVSYLDQDVIKKSGIEIDYDWVIDRTLRSPIERILEAAGISWENVLGYENLNDFFG